MSQAKATQQMKEDDEETRKLMEHMQKSKEHLESQARAASPTHYTQGVPTLGHPTPMEKELAERMKKGGHSRRRSGKRKRTRISGNTRRKSGTRRRSAKRKRTRVSGHTRRKSVGAGYFANYRRPSPTIDDRVLFQNGVKIL